MPQKVVVCNYRLCNVIKWRILNVILLTGFNVISRKIKPPYCGVIQSHNGGCEIVLPTGDTGQRWGGKKKKAPRVSEFTSFVTARRGDRKREYLSIFNGDFVRSDFHDYLRESTEYVEPRRRKLRVRVPCARKRGR